MLLKNCMKVPVILVLAIILAGCVSADMEQPPLPDYSSGSGDGNGEGRSSSSFSNSSNIISSSSFSLPYGALKACKIGGKGQICGSTGSYATTAVQVRGVSLGWSNTGWEPSAFFNAATVNAMVDNWKAQIIRVPMGYSEDGGYKTDASNWTRVKTAVDAALAKGVYVIIDWHSHNAHNETSAAMTFFGTTVKEYHNVPNIIFEIYNEPEQVTWATVRTYATSVISAIRTAGANNLILVGTPSWGQNVNAPLDNPLTDNNIAYVAHFYAYSHPWSDFSAKITAVLNAGYPVFVSEYGTTHYDGGQSGDGHYNTHSAANTDTWHTNMDLHKISSCAWNINDKYEGSAFFGTSSTGRFSQTAANFANESMMTASGKYIYNKLRNYANSGGGTAMNCQFGSHCYEMSSDDCSSYGGTLSSCTKTTIGCSDYCLWDTGCWEITTDPYGVYGAPYSTCTVAIQTCVNYGLGHFTNSTCSVSN
jgi:aryl-phospho-beta-D-glucosidase BglC (GH1 family)